MCKNSNHQQCCTDSVTEDCANMDPSCAWECGAGNVTDGESHVTIEHLEDEGDTFCNGAGTDMFMQGFQVGSGSSPQVILRLNHFRAAATQRTCALSSCSTPGSWTPGPSSLSPASG